MLVFDSEYITSTAYRFRVDGVAKEHKPAIDSCRGVRRRESSVFDTNAATISAVLSKTAHRNRRRYMRGNMQDKQLCV
jgi:hypothetical protein